VEKNKLPIKYIDERKICKKKCEINKTKEHIVEINKIKNMNMKVKKQIKERRERVKKK
jgi:hypothetical protein